MKHSRRIIGRFLCTPFTPSWGNGTPTLETNFGIYHTCCPAKLRNYSTNNNSDRESKWSRNFWKKIAGVGVLVATGAGVYLYGQREYSRRNIVVIAHAKLVATDVKDTKAIANAQGMDYVPPACPDLPVYTRADIRKHARGADSLWVTFKHGVYDISEFVQAHPGGDKILLAAGGSLEPFWNLYAQHKSGQVVEILESLRIGSVDPNDVEKGDAIDPYDPYSGDPQRHPALVVNSAKPFNAETPVELLTDSFLTPTQLFFVRNHLPVPTIDPKSYRLSLTTDIGGLASDKSVDFTLSDLQTKFKKHSVTSVVQCAGNRRAEMHSAKPVKGLAWKGGAISNAKWTGVRLKDVLMAAGYDESKIEQAGFKHVHFEGYDADPIEKNCYGASIPIHKALSNEVLLAYKMNDDVLPTDHGYPIRVIVPGVVGARQVKWLRKITLSEYESPSHWQQKDYRSFMPSMDYDTVDYSTAPAIQDYPIQSMITQVDNQAVIEQGKTWHLGKLEQEPGQGPNTMWAWTFWTVELPLSGALKPGDTVQLVCKAVDSSYNQQPEQAMSIWNMRGLLTNCWHRIDVTIQK